MFTDVINDMDHLRLLRYVIRLQQAQDQPVRSEVCTETLSALSKDFRAHFLNEYERLQGTESCPPILLDELSDQFSRFKKEFAYLNSTILHSKEPQQIHEILHQCELWITDHIGLKAHDYIPSPQRSEASPPEQPTKNEFC
jgi:hypothetical protein